MPFRIDSHQSFTPEHPPEHFGPILKRNRFAGSVWVADRYSPSAAGFDFVLAVVAAGAAGLDEWRAHPKFRGVLWNRLEGEVPRDGETLDLLLHPSQLAEAASMARTHPEQKIAVDHLGSPDIASGDFEAWVRGMEELAQCPAVCCKLSGLVRLGPSPWKAADLRPYVHHALRCFGPHRLMFGSGWPDCLPEYAWKETLAAFTQSLGAAPIDLRELLLGGTAARFYGIEIPAGAADL